MGGPRRRSKSPQRINESLFVNVSKDAWESADVDINDPDEWEEFWFPEEDVIAFDLSGGDEP